MNLVYYLLYSHDNLDLDSVDLVNMVEEIIVTKFPYKEMVKINKRDLNIALFEKNVKKIKFNKSF